MADKELLDVLFKGGVESWNRSRNSNLLLCPHYHGADLAEANLSGANLSMADFRGANLSRADLSGADLSGADLNGAGLNGTNISLADLSRANLEKSRLFNTIFKASTLNLSNFSKAVMGNASFDDCDLSSTKGLEEVSHSFPSSIGIDTIFKSQGKIPQIFLINAGVSQHFIDYIPSFIGTPWEYYSCFISYSSKNQDIADRLHADLQAKGVRCWLATEDLKIGDKFRKEIDKAIKMYDKLLLILSETSISSTWVEDEVESAFEKERKKKEKGNSNPALFPIRIDRAIFDSEEAWAESIRRTRHIGDFTKWTAHEDYTKAFNRLLRDLQNSDRKDTGAGD